MPVRIGLESVRANVRPMLTLWTIAVTLALAYYFVPGVKHVFKPIGEWQDHMGWVAAFVNCAFFCGVLPYVVYLCKGRLGPRRPFLTAVLQALWSGFHGIICNWFFQMQSVWFGSGHDVRTLFVKMVVDQFVWTVLVMAPSNALFYALVGKWIEGTRTEFSFRIYLQSDYLPNLFMGWCIWIPVIISVYTFPSSLQIQVLGFISASWVVVCREIGAHK